MRPRSAIRAFPLVAEPSRVVSLRAEARKGEDAPGEARDRNGEGAS